MTAFCAGYITTRSCRVGSALPCKQLAGFSTFGEILGLNLNQTLTAVFFFRVPEGTPFRDDYVDNL
jgi:hypothetical protein